MIPILALLLAATAAPPPEAPPPDAPPAAPPAAAAAPPSLHDPLPFDHEAHARTFEKKDVTCMTCHPVGMAPATDAEVQALPAQAVPAPRSTCHGCHLGEVPGAPRKAASTCGSCHADLRELLPADHGPTWLSGHAAQARVMRADCDDCHQVQWCFECHDDRGPTAVDPHPPGFSALHGVEARLDPSSCSSCHAATACTDCHRTGSSPW